MGGGTGTGGGELIVMEVLDERYNECDLYGHLKPANSKNMCNYCYRHLEYHTPRADAIANENDGVPFMQQTINAPIVMEEARDEISFQKDTDRLHGLARIAKELTLV